MSVTEYLCQYKTVMSDVVLFYLNINEKIVNVIKFIYSII